MFKVFKLFFYHIQLKNSVKHWQYFLTGGRELKMKELKEEVERLKNGRNLNQNQKRFPSFLLVYLKPN